MFTQSTGNNYILDRVGNEVEKLYSNYARSDLNDKWVFTIGGIRNARITIVFLSRVSRHLPGTGRGIFWYVFSAKAVVKMNCPGINVTNYFM